MKKIKFGLIMLIVGLNIASAQSANFYAYFINNSTNKTVRNVLKDYTRWDNRGWGNCRYFATPNIAILKPGETGVRCGGTTSRSVNGWLTYTISVTGQEGTTFFKEDNVWSVHNDAAAALEVWGRNGGSFQDWFTATEGTDDKDIVIVYVFDDYGVSTTLLKYDHYTASEHIKDFDLIGHHCSDIRHNNECTTYQKY